MELCRVRRMMGAFYWYDFPLCRLWRDKKMSASVGRFVGYISNHIFPKPLTEIEEKDCLQKFAAGNEDARNILIEHNLRLVAHICKKFESTGLDKDDLISIGTIGLIKGINTFQADKGTRLATYAARCIEKPILRSWKQNKSKIKVKYVEKNIPPYKDFIRRYVLFGEILRFFLQWYLFQYG